MTPWLQEGGQQKEFPGTHPAHDQSTASIILA